MEFNALIVIEVIMVFGGTMAFCIWQLSDLRKEAKKDKAKAEAAAESKADDSPP